MHELGQNITSKEKKEKDLGVVIQSNISPEKYIDRIFGDTCRMLRNIRMTFHLPDKNNMTKIITIKFRPEIIWSPHCKKHVLKLERIQRIPAKMVPDLEVLTYEKRLKEMQQTTLKERRERGDSITVYKLMNNMEETN